MRGGSVRKTRLELMTWKEAEEAFAANPVILIPNASTEQHGPQTPVGDFRIAQVVGERIAEATGALLAPMLPFGYSDVFRGFPGTISLQAETVHRVMYDVASSFLDHGLDHLVFLCGHGGNMPILEHVARRIRHERGIRLACLDLWRLHSPATIAEAYGRPIRNGHGSDPITSFWLHLFPEQVRLDLVEPEALTPLPGLAMRGVSQVMLGDVSAQIYFDAGEVSRNGVLGDVTVFNAEAGGALLDHVVAKGIEFVALFRAHNTRIGTSGRGQA